MNVRRRLRARRLRSAAGSINSGRHILESRRAERCANDAFLTSFRATLSRPAALWNCRVLWPRCSRFLFNCYRGYATILVRSLSTGKLHTILSREGTTQGCPLAMLMYAVRVCPQISRLKDPAQHKQNWYADDSSCGGRLVQIKA